MISLTNCVIKVEKGISKYSTTNGFINRIHNFHLRFFSVEIPIFWISLFSRKLLTILIKSKEIKYQSTFLPDCNKPRYTGIFNAWQLLGPWWLLIYSWKLGSSFSQIANLPKTMLKIFIFKQSSLILALLMKWE